MKNLFYALALAGAASGVAHAQDAPPAAPAAPSTTATTSTAEDTGDDVRFGIKVFGGIATLIGRDAEVITDYVGARPTGGTSASLTTEPTQTLSAGGGVAADVRLTDNFSVKPELLYVTKGTRVNTDQLDTKLNLRYISLPLLVRYQQQGVFLEAGPQLSYLLSAKLTQEAAAGGTSPADNTSRDLYNEAEWGYAFGLGYEVADAGLTFTARYNGAFRPLLPRRNNTSIEAYNSGLELHVGYFFSKK